MLVLRLSVRSPQHTNPIPSNRGHWFHRTHAAREAESLNARPTASVQIRCHHLSVLAHGFELSLSMAACQWLCAHARARGRAYGCAHDPYLMITAIGTPTDYICVPIAVRSRAGAWLRALLSQLKFDQVTGVHIDGSLSVPLCPGTAALFWGIQM